jgi:CspA family cold shock protein
LVLIQHRKKEKEDSHSFGDTNSCDFFIFVLLKTQIEESEAVIQNMKGTVKWYNAMKGFGFLTGDDGNETFVHRSSVPAEMNLSEGDSVEYQIEDSDRGTRATNLKKN